MTETELDQGYSVRTFSVDGATESFFATVDSPETGLGTSTRGSGLSESRPSKKGKKDDADDWIGFRRLAVELFDYARELKESVEQGVAPMNRADLILEFETCLRKLYRVKFGQEECLARCVTAIESVVLRETWTEEHVAFVFDATSFLKARSHIDPHTVKQIYGIIKDHGLDIFRGVL